MLQFVDMSLSSLFWTGNVCEFDRLDYIRSDESWFSCSTKCYDG